MDLKVHLLYFRNIIILAKLIQDNAPYDKILEQSNICDKYINLEMQYINEKRS